MAQRKGCKKTGGKKKGSTSIGSGRTPDEVLKTLGELKAQYATDVVPKIFAYLSATAQDESKDDDIRLKASKELLDRVCGKPDQEIRHTGSISNQSPEERAAEIDDIKSYLQGVLTSQPARST